MLNDMCFVFDYSNARLEDWHFFYPLTQGIEFLKLQKND